MQPLLDDGHAGLAVLGARGAVDHHREVDVVEVPEAQQLGLAAEELQLPRPCLAHAPLDVAVLFRGDGEEHEAARQVRGGLGVEQAHRGAHQPGELRVVTARVRRPRHGIRFGMACHHERIELSEHRERRAVAGLAANVCPHAGDREPALGREPDLRERLLDELCGLELLEPKLRLAPDLLAEADDGVSATVDGGVDLLLQIVFRHVRQSFMNRFGRKSLMSIEGCPCVIISVISRAVIGARRIPFR